MMILQRRQNRAEALEENEVRDLRDQPEQCFGDERCDDAHRNGQPDEHEHAGVRAEVPQGNGLLARLRFTFRRSRS